MIDKKFKKLGLITLTVLGVSLIVGINCGKGGKVGLAPDAAQLEI
jgi:hypothetical protein